MSITLIEFDAAETDVPLTDALKYMGVKGDAPEITSLAEIMLPQLRSVSSPKACYAEYPVVRDGETVKIGSIVSNSIALRKNLSGCDRAVIFAATVGVGVDRLLSTYSRTEPSKAVIISALGSAMIESICDEVCCRFGKCIRPRFSPGYGGFDLSAQREIADILETEKRIGLYITDSMMMIPEKSVTAVVGICEK